MNENIRDKWSANLDEEISFWRKMLLNWKNDSNTPQMNPKLPFRPMFKELLPDASEYDILDVGAGPISALGTEYPGKKLNIKAVDPLADIYNNILSEYGMVPRVVTEKLDGERLSDSLSLNSFDLVYSRNALDHSYDPIGCIDEILKVLKDNCYCVLDQFPNEGTGANWRGLHQWDFYREDETFFIADRNKNIINVNKHYENRADIVCAKYDWHHRLFYILIKKI